MLAKLLNAINELKSKNYDITEIHFNKNQITITFFISDDEVYELFINNDITLLNELKYVKSELPINELLTFIK